MEYKINNTTLVIFLEGQLSSANADQVTTEIEEIRANNAHDSLIIDLGKITYVSSAGLRLFLNLRKKEASFKVTNVAPDVYEVFSITGFAEIMTVEKALKVVSIEGKELIGQGYMGKVFRMDPETIIKVNYRVDSIESIQRERELAKKAFVLGVPTAISYDVVKVKEGGFGSMFELITDDSLCGLIKKHPENLDEYIRIYGELLGKINAAEDLTSQLPSKKDTALSWVKDLRNYDVFDKETLDHMEALINEVPEMDNLIHGDFHIKNVMMQNGEALLIDMDTLGRGHPLFELTPMFLTYVGYPSTEPGNLQSFFGISDEQGDKIYKNTLKTFLKTDDMKVINDVVDKTALLGYMWLALKTLMFEPENKVRLNHAVEMVNKLKITVKTLIF